MAKVSVVWLNLLPASHIHPTRSRGARSHIATCTLSRDSEGWLGSSGIPREMPSASSLLCTVVVLLASADAFVPHAIDGATHRTVDHGQHRRQLAVRCSDEDTTPVDRLFACLPYMLPVVDGFGYGAYVYQNVPLAGDLAMALC